MREDSPFPAAASAGEASLQSPRFQPAFERRNHPPLQIAVGGATSLLPASYHYQYQYHKISVISLVTKILHAIAMNADTVDALERAKTARRRVNCAAYILAFKTIPNNTCVTQPFACPHNYKGETRTGNAWPGLATEGSVAAKQSLLKRADAGSLTGKLSPAPGAFQKRLPQLPHGVLPVGLQRGRG